MEEENIQTQDPNIPETNTQQAPTSTPTPAPEIPPEIKGWNWGAFFLNFIWGIAHNVWISLLVFVPYLGFVIPFILGFKGSEWAWQHRTFESVEQFKLVQKAWAKWGLIIFIINLIFVITFFGVVLAALKSLSSFE